MENPTKDKLTCGAKRDALAKLKISEEQFDQLYDD